MLLNMLTQTINTVINDIEPTDVKITVGCLLYSYLNGQETKIDLRNKALSFKDYYISEVTDRKIRNRTVGFITIEGIIKDKKYESLDNISTNDYEKILKAYDDTQLEVKYNPNSLDPMTYGKHSFKGSYEKERFSYLHNEILKPIASYCKNKYNVPYSNLRIVSVADTVIPAKEIVFFIVGYSSNRLIQDIEQGLILFNGKIDMIKLTTDSFIHIII